MALKSYDYSMNKLVAKGSGMVTGEAVPAGAPLLSIPLTKCWTKSRATKDCWPVAKALQEASVRNPTSALLKADATYIMMHLIYDKKQMPTSADRKAYLGQLPTASVEVPATAKSDYDTLALELGPGVVSTLGLTYDGYLWASQVCAKFGLVFAVEGGSMMVLAPGFELLGGGESAAIAKVEDDCLYLMAEKAYSSGAKVGFAGTVSKPQSVSVSMKLFDTPMTRGLVDKLMGLLAGTEVAPVPGCIMPTEPPKPIVAVSEGGATKFEVTLELTREKPLPSTDIMQLLGVAVLADPAVLESTMEKEAGKPDVLQTAMCEKRALLMLKPMLEEMGDDDDTGIVSAALEELRSRSVSPAELPESTSSDDMVIKMPGSGLSLAWPLNGDMGPDTTIGKAMETLKGCVKGLEDLASKFAALKKSGKFGDAGKEMLTEFAALKACMTSAGLGDPAAVTGKPATDSKNPVVKVFSEATSATLKVTMAVAEWEVAGFEKAKSSLELAKALCKLGSLKMSASDFAGAHTDLQKSMSLSPTAGAASLALECAMALASVSDSVLGGKLDGAALQAVKSKFASKGYTGAAVPVPERAPAPLPSAAAALGSDLVSEALLEDCSASHLGEFVRLFVLHRAMPLKKVVLLLGPKVCTTLLENGVLSCYSDKVLTPAEGVKLVNHPAQRGSTVIFSNVALQPLGDLLIASDFDYSASTFTPVPYVAEDTCAVAAACTGGSAVLDYSCGSGALGLAALAAGASKAAFCDSSARALKFAKFNASLNGLEGKATFSSSPSGKFDTILSSPVCLPNPGSVVTSKGPMYSAGEDGTDALLTCIKSALGVMSTDAKLMAAAMVPNGSGLVDKISGLLTNAGKASCSILPGSALPAEACLLKSLTTGVAPAQQFAYAAGLKKAGLVTMSQALVVICSSTAKTSGSKVDMLPASPGLWTDTAGLKTEVGKVLTSVTSTAEVQTMIAGGAGAKMYDMDWEDEGSTTAGSEAEATITPKPAPTSSAWDPKSKSKKTLVKKTEYMDLTERKEGARWQDVNGIDNLGFNFPLNAVSRWYPYPKELPLVEMPDVLPRFAVVELPGARIPGDVLDAFRDVFDCKLKFTIDSVKQQLKPMAPRSTYRKRRGLDTDDWEKTSIDDADIFLVPVPPDDFKDAEIVALPLQMVYLFQILADKARSGAKITCMIITCNAHPGAPPVEGYTDFVAPAVTLGGMSRTIKLEIRPLTTINLDTDAFRKRGDPLELCTQISVELSARDGINEMCYRDGKRWIRQLDVSTRNPITPTAIMPPWPYGDDGVLFITGGNGGLGVVTAEGLVEVGCKNIVLGSRSGKPREGQGLEERIAKMQAAGVNIVNMKCDTSNEQAVIDCLQETRTNIGPIKAIVHAAGVLADQLLDFQTEGTMRTSFEPKSNGAWYLHKHTVGVDDIKAFICFSSVSSLQGNPGQANYSSSNAYMDGLCDWRVQQGLPGMAFMWPAVYEVGMAAAGVIKGMDWDENQFVGPSHVKQCMTRCINTESPYESLVAVLPLGNIWMPPEGYAAMPSMLWFSDRLFNGMKPDKPYVVP
mmetsp:Transcript_154832/g.288666  ORF Transcript_154832/g.288666 Transcript_154832/m.288666 type:complete len:1556 (-) Transcript_154832:81-4748(-)